MYNEKDDKGESNADGYGVIPKVRFGCDELKNRETARLYVPNKQ
jgi:hypothetical protein